MARTRISSKFNRCVKSVKKTVRARKGSNKESASIAICVKSVLHKRGRTLKSYTRKRLITQKKLRGGATVSRWAQYSARTEVQDKNDPLPEMERLAQDILADSQLSPQTSLDEEHVVKIFIDALKTGSMPLLRALKEKGVSKEFMLHNIETLMADHDIPRDARVTIRSLHGPVSNFS